LSRYDEKRGSGQRYLYSDGTYQGGYECSIRAVTEWENYRSGYLFQHPNYFSQYMDQKIEDDGSVYTHWKNMGWEATYKKTFPRELHESFLNITDKPRRTYIYTDEGYMRGGEWLRTDMQWKKGKCIVEFQRVCNENTIVTDLESTSHDNKIIDGYPIVQDTDLVSHFCKFLLIFIHVCPLFIPSLVI
jgi:hypothetical protein